MLNIRRSQQKQEQNLQLTVVGRNCNFSKNNRYKVSRHRCRLTAVVKGLSNKAYKYGRLTRFQIISKCFKPNCPQFGISALQMVYLMFSVYYIKSLIRTIHLKNALGVHLQSLQGLLQLRIAGSLVIDFIGIQNQWTCILLNQVDFFYSFNHIYTTNNDHNILLDNLSTRQAFDLLLATLIQATKGGTTNYKSIEFSNRLNRVSA